MKILLIFGIFLLLIGCTSPTFTEDPSLKESERIAVLEKAKTDTLSTIVEMDNKYYIIKDNKIEKRTSKLQNDPFLMFVSGVLTVLIIGIFIYATD